MFRNSYEKLNNNLGDSLLSKPETEIDVGKTSNEIKYSNFASAERGQGLASLTRTINVVVPSGVIPGNKFAITVPGVGFYSVSVPAGLKAGDRFPVQIPKEALYSDENAIAKQERDKFIQVVVPQNAKPGEKIVVHPKNASHKSYVVIIPRNAKPGETLRIKVKDSSTDVTQQMMIEKTRNQVKVVVPKGAKPGSVLLIDVPGGRDRSKNKMMTVKVKVPKDAVEGTTLIVHV
eukprot:g2534.t1